MYLYSSTPIPFSKGHKHPGEKVLGSKCGPWLKFQTRNVTFKLQNMTDTHRCDGKHSGQPNDLCCNCARRETSHQAWFPKHLDRNNHDGGRKPAAVVEERGGWGCWQRLPVVTWHKYQCSSHRCGFFFIINKSLWGTIVPEWTPPLPLPSTHTLSPHCLCLRTRSDSVSAQQVGACLLGWCVTGNSSNSLYL